VPLRRWVPAALTAAAALCLCAFYAWPLRRDRFTCTTPSVGHGLATVLELPGGKCVVYDCGNIGNMDVGRNVVAPLLWRQRRCEIDAVVLSHPDGDHVNGVPGLLDRFRVHRLIVSPYFEDSEIGRAVILVARARGVPVETRAAGDGFEISPGCVVRFAWPPRVGNAEGFRGNDLSLVMRVECGGRSVLLTGDAENAALERMADAGLLEPADVMQVPHHGSKGSADWRAIDAVKTMFGVVSSTREVREEVRAQYSRAGTLLLNTNDTGCVSIELAPEMVRVLGTGDADDFSGGQAGRR
jgi:competence protein ComEC